MKKALVTVGLGFGDEGKGATVAALASRHQAKLVVRYCGGAQAAHSVVDGRRVHTFHLFGSGTFSGARTLLAEKVMVNPITLAMEAAELRNKGVCDPLDRIAIDPRCLVTTPYHVALGRLDELFNSHGSCGAGIGKTRQLDLEHPDLSIRFGDLASADGLHLKLALLRDFAIWAWAHEDKSELEADPLKKAKLDAVAGILASDQEFEDTIHVLRHLGQCVRKPYDVDEITLCDSDVIFEGAQGVLLDEDFGFHPHTTWSKTTSASAVSLVERTGNFGGGAFDEIEVIGILRAYQTRHGAGPLPTEDAELTNCLQPLEIHNPQNEWQRAMRFGWFDQVLASYAIKCDGHITSLAINHVDQIAEFWRAIPVVKSYSHSRMIGSITEIESDDRGEDSPLTHFLSSVKIEAGNIDRLSCDDNYPREIASRLGIPLSITGHGPATADREFIKEPVPC